MWTLQAHCPGRSHLPMKEVKTCKTKVTSSDVSRLEAWTLSYTPTLGVRTSQILKISSSYRRREAVEEQMAEAVHIKGNDLTHQVLQTAIIRG